MDHPGPQLGRLHHLVGGIAGQGADVLAHEGQREVVGHLAAVDDGGARGEEMTQPLPCLEDFLLRDLALRDVRQRPVRAHHPVTIVNGET